MVRKMYLSMLVFCTACKFIICGIDAWSIALNENDVIHSPEDVFKGVCVELYKLC